MQLFWVSGSTGAIKQINITKERLVRLGILVCGSFLLLGILIFSTGIHIALEVNPEFAREVSGVVTVKERMALDQRYAKQLKQTQDQLAKASLQFNELKSIPECCANCFVNGSIRTPKLLVMPSRASIGGPIGSVRSH